MGKVEQKTKHFSGSRNLTLELPVSALSQYVSCIFMEATEGKTVPYFGSLNPDADNSKYFWASFGVLNLIYQKKTDI